jgi:hypothetical protein
MLSGITYVTSLDLNGLPIEPPEARKVFKCACGFQVRDNVSVTIQDLWLVRGHKGAALEEYYGEDQVSRWRR